MPDYAKLGREAFERQEEITCEEFRIYSIIVFHSYVEEAGVRICKKTLEELCRIYAFLDYDNTSRRVKRLRTGKFSKGEKPKRVAPMKSPWIKKQGKFLLPLVGVKTVNITVFEDEKTVKNTVSDCKNYSKRKKKTVKNTVPLFFKDKSLNEPINSTSTAEENFAADAGQNSNGHLSKFSLAECLLYAQISKSKGENIKNVHALANSAFKSGELDVFIQAVLYPETNELTYEKDADTKLYEAIELLLEVRSEGEDVNEYRKWYSAEEWQWLMEELKERD